MSAPRLPEIDFIRGIALLGIFLMNIDFMSTSTLVSDWHEGFTNTFDAEAGKYKFLYLAQRFIGIFSFLFGLSIAIQKQNFKDQKKAFAPYYFRRAALLLVLGILHVLFFFMGDILSVYALLSLLLFCCFALSNRALLIAAALVFVIPAAFESLQMIEIFIDGVKRNYDGESLTETYRHGTLLQMMKARLTEYFYLNLTSVVWKKTSFATMILGFLIGRNGWHRTYTDQKKIVRRLFVFCFIYCSGFALYVHIFMPRPEFSWWFHGLYNLYVLLTIAVYIFILLFIYNSGKLKRFCTWIANVGRLSMSNYIFQSIIGAFIFTRYGLELYAKTTPTENILIVLGIYILQIMLSSFYLKKFKAGPLEWLWHKLVY